MVEDMDVDLDKEFLQELKELKILINDKDLLDQHKRYQGKNKYLIVGENNTECKNCILLLIVPALQFGVRGSQRKD